MVESIRFVNITDDVEFDVQGSSVAYYVVPYCESWDAAINLQMQSANGDWLTVYGQSNNAINYPTLGTGRYKWQNVSSLGAPLSISLSSVPLTATDGVIFTNITTPQTFQLAGGQYGMISTSDNDIPIYALAADGVHWVYTGNYSGATGNEWWWGPGTYKIVPAGLSSISIVGTDNLGNDTVILNGITEDTEFTIKGGPLVNQVAITNATWDNQVVFDQQRPDGTWIQCTGWSENSWRNPGFGPSRCRLRGVSTLTSPLYFSITNVPPYATDRVIYTDITEAVTFTLQGGLYGVITASADSTTPSFNFPFQATDGTFLDSGYAPNSATTQYFGAGVYKVDPTGLTAPLSVSITGMPL